LPRLPRAKPRGLSLLFQIERTYIIVDKRQGLMTPGSSRAPSHVAISDTHVVTRGKSQLLCLGSMKSGIPKTNASLDVSAILFTGIRALANVAAQHVKENHRGALPKSV
jgi:hypothetical protein